MSQDRKKRRAPTGPSIPIAVGILLRENRVLVALRKEGSHLAGTWEFPGGAIRPDEEPEAGLRREIDEELGIKFQKATLFHRKRHAYPDREVDLHYYLCTGILGEPSGVEEQEVRWVSAVDLEHLPIPPANFEVVAMLQDQLG